MPDDEDLELDWHGRAPRGTEMPASAPSPSVPAVHRPHGLPGDPIDMSDELRLQLGGLLEGPGVRVRQQVEALQVLVGWDQANKYEVSGLDGRPIFWAMEEPRGVLGALSRNLNPFYRNVTECVTGNGTVALKVEFPWSPFLRRAEVQAWDGRMLGRIRQRFHLLRTRLDVESPAGQVLLQIRGPLFRFFFWRDWVLDVMHGERVVAQVKRLWPGFFQAEFSNADNFSVEFAPEMRDGRLRQLLVAATLTLDLTRFERRGERTGLQRLLGD
jgi:uncharacterized protein YxjI